MRSSSSPWPTSKGSAVVPTASVTSGAPPPLVSIHKSPSGTITTNAIGTSYSNIHPISSIPTTINNNTNPTTSASGLGLAILRNNLRMGLTRDIRDGQRALREENYILEEILSEQHHMLTASDMAEVLRGGANNANNGGANGVRSSAILASRKPVERLLVRQRGLERARLTADEGPSSYPPESRTKRAMLIADSQQSHPEVAVVRSVDNKSERPRSGALFPALTLQQQENIRTSSALGGDSHVRTTAGRLAASSPTFGKRNSVISSFNDLSPYNRPRALPSSVTSASPHLITRASSPSARLHRVNYKELLIEQEDMQVKANMKNEHYEALLKEALRFQELQNHFGE